MTLSFKILLCLLYFLQRIDGFARLDGVNVKNQTAVRTNETAGHDDMIHGCLYECSALRAFQSGSLRWQCLTVLLIG